MKNPITKYPPEYPPFGDACRQKLDRNSDDMRQRFGIAVALLGDRELMILDGPTVGLEGVCFNNAAAHDGQHGRQAEMEVA